MLERDSFAELMDRIRARDEEAAGEFVRRYEPEIRREVRLRLRDQRMRRAFDSIDVCQSVLASFLVRVGHGEYVLDGPEQLRALLVAMTRNKLVRHVRREQASRRDVRRVESMDSEHNNNLTNGPSPSRLAAGKEMLHEFYDRLSPEELSLVDRRSEGRSWIEIAGELGGTADSRRKQFGRAIARISRQIGLDAGSND